MTEFDSTVGPVPMAVKNRIYVDNRGTFQEMYSTARNALQVAQVNHSYSVQGTVRGLHWQVPPYDIAKYVTVVMGEIEDVVVDLRRASKTFGKWRSYELYCGGMDAVNDLSSYHSRALLVPSGFAHGFVVKSANAHVVYMQDKTWCPEAERCLYYADPSVGIPWKTLLQGVGKFIVSQKDNQGRRLKELTDADLFP